MSSTAQNTKNPSSLAEITPQIFVSIVEGRGVASEIGMTCINLFTSECVIYQVFQYIIKQKFSDTQTYSKTLHKIYLLDPAAIILPQSAIEPLKSKLCTLITESFSDIKLIPLPRKNYNEQSGIQFIKHYGIQDEISTLLMEMTSKFYAIVSLSSLFTFMESNQTISHARHTIQFKFHTIDGVMMLDITTAKNLELVANLNLKNGPCLLNILDHTQTRMGSRLLRMNILQPLCTETTITTRLNAVQELNSNLELVSLIRTCLKSFPDIDHVIGSLNIIHRTSGIKNSEQAINNVLALKYLLKKIQDIIDPISELKSRLFISMNSIFRDDKLNLMLGIIHSTINEDVTFQKKALGLRNQRCFAVKSGFNGLLDVARQTYKETTDDVYDLITFYSEKYELPFKTNFQASIGFDIGICMDDLGDKDLPLEFINVVKKKKKLSFTTLKLMSLNERIHESLTEVYLMSDNVILDVIHRIRDEISILYKVSECIAMLDMLVVFSFLCTKSRLVKPEFGDTLAIKSGRHPIKSILKDSFIPNDSFASLESNLVLITGPNMSGKSTYLVQIALITIMSHMGCFVPAECAYLRITDTLFTRIGSNDSLQSNASSFMLEMKEMAFVFQNLTCNSLVIIDELGRGTCFSDGLGITFAVCEALVKTEAFIFLATHFKELSKFLEIYPNVHNLHLKMQNVENKTKMKYLYMAERGVCEEEHYGIRVAEIAGLSTKITNRAQEISIQLDNDLKRNTANTSKRPERAKLQFMIRFKKAYELWNGSEDGLKIYLQGLYEDFKDMQY